MNVRRALFLSTSQRYVALVLNFATMTVVSRILTHGEIGVSIVSMAIVNIMIAVREFAGENFIFQQRDLKTETMRNVFTVIFLLSFAMASILIVSANWLAHAYGDVRLAPYLHVVAVCIFLEIFTLPIIARWRHEMAFGKIMLVNVAGTTTMSSFTIGLALAGFSYMSFAWAWLVMMAVTVFMALAIDRRFEILKPRFKGLGAVFAFGGYHGATEALLRLYEAVPYLMLGRYISVGAAAMFNRGLSICQLPDKMLMSGVSSVALPAFSKQAQNGSSLKTSYLAATRLVTAMKWPGYIMLVILAYPVVNLVLGDQWDLVVPIVRIVAVGMLFSFAFELNYPVLVAVGSVRVVFLIALFVMPVSAAVIAIASLFGMTATAWAMTLIVPFQAIVSIQFLRRHIGVSWKDLANSVRESVIVTISTAIGPLAIIAFGDGGFDMTLGRAMICCSAGFAGWILSLYGTNHPLFSELVNILRSLKKNLFSTKLSDAKI